MFSFLCHINVQALVLTSASLGKFSLDLSIASKVHTVRQSLSFFSVLIQAGESSFNLSSALR